MMRLPRLMRAACWAAFVLWLPPAAAEVYQAEGIASLEAGVVAAREAAVQDALRQIAITHQGGLVASSNTVAGLQTQESLMLGPLTGPPHRHHLFPTGAANGRQRSWQYCHLVSGRPGTAVQPAARDPGFVRRWRVHFSWWCNARGQRSGRY